jgi:hypothetical protein
MQRMLIGCLLAAGVVAVTVGGEPTRGAHASHVALEQVRLRAHFDSVLDQLRARDVSRLTTGQRAARLDLTTWLAEYRDAGSFPLNDRYSGSETPIFRDTRGVTCAMAYLIERSGRRDIVDRVARTRNLAYVPELADDSALVSWLDSVGFDVEEAARVQPTYGTPESRRNVDKEYAVASMVASGASLVSATWNLAKPNKATGVLGLIAGGLTVLVGTFPGTADATGTDGDRAVGRINIYSGGAAIVAGFWALSRKERRDSSRSIPESRGANWGVTLDPLLRNANGAQVIRVGLAGQF